MTPWMGVTPDAPDNSLRSSRLLTPISGANTFTLGYDTKDVTASRSELGLRTDESWAMQDAILTLRGRFAHDFNIDRQYRGDLPGAARRILCRQWRRTGA